MTVRKYVALAGMAVFLSACIPSVNPFYTEKDIVFEERLLGDWRAKEENDDPQGWKFEKGEEKSYKLTVREKTGKEGEFEAHLFKLKQEQFLDLVPSECRFDTNQADMISFAIFPGHLLVRVSQLEPELKLAFFDFDWLEKFLGKNPKALAHRREGIHQDKGILLTADTRDLQQFVLQHLGKDELFKEPTELIRKSPKASAATPPPAK